MEELKCKECGAVLAQNAKECPVCGCPVDVTEATPIEVKGEPIAQNTSVKTAKAKAVDLVKGKKSVKINFMAVISLILGVVIIVMGAKVAKMKVDVDVDTFTPKHYDADTAMFKGDFYTEIYEATDIIVDELDETNSGIASLSQAIATMSDTMANAIYYPIGMLIIALGLGVIAVSCIHILDDGHGARKNEAQSMMIDKDELPDL